MAPSPGTRCHTALAFCLDAGAFWSSNMILRLQWYSCYTCPRSGRPSLMRKVLQAPESWAQAGACVTDMAVQAACTIQVTLDMPQPLHLQTTHGLQTSWSRSTSCFWSLPPSLVVLRFLHETLVCGCLQSCMPWNSRLKMHASQQLLSAYWDLDVL